VRYFDVNQNPVMINQEGMVYRLETDNMLVQESANYQLSEEAIELTEVSFLSSSNHSCRQRIRLI